MVLSDMNHDKNLALLRAKTVLLFWSTWFLCHITKKRLVSGAAIHGDIGFFLDMGTFILSIVVTGLVIKFMRKHVSKMILLTIIVTGILIFW